MEIVYERKIRWFEIEFCAHWMEWERVPPSEWFVSVVCHESANAVTLWKTFECFVVVQRPIELEHTERDQSIRFIDFHIDFNDQQVSLILKYLIGCCDWEASNHRKPKSSVKRPHRSVPWCMAVYCVNSVLYVLAQHSWLVNHFDVFACVFCNCSSLIVWHCFNEICGVTCNLILLVRWHRAIHKWAKYRLNNDYDSWELECKNVRNSVREMAIIQQTATERTKLKL